ncbi:MAG: hypothetical protein HY244_16610 [Rhizobiales bacterium]|nr:hypothetical protein [Hyphomicrobiales bacterium]
MANQNDDVEQARVWDILYARLQEILRPFGKDDFLGRGDYWIVDDNWGPRRHTIYINNLEMLAPSIVKLIQASLADYPDWEIVADVSSKQYAQLWPAMGLIIRSHEIIDGLQRQYFPKEFQGIEYDGSKHEAV